MPPATTNMREILLAARRVADFASAHGAHSKQGVRRASYDHLGAVLADSVLQAGLNYNTVVRPRVSRILRDYPETRDIAALVEIVRAGMTEELLDWSHPVKAERFRCLVLFCEDSRIQTTEQLQSRLLREDFCIDLQKLNGVGPKTVDYMSCLVGIDSIAVDRHIKSFAVKAGLFEMDYSFLKRAFCFAADLLSISRREFDYWVWTNESRKNQKQLSLAFE